MNRYASLALMLGAATVVACGDAARQNLTAPARGAAIKFFNFGVAAPGVYFYANGQKITAISTALCQPPNDTLSVCRTTGNDSTVGAAPGAAGNGGMYNQLTPAQYTLTAATALTNTHVTIATTSTTLADGKFYSYYLSGIYDPVGKTVDAFVIEDPLPAISDYTMAYVRFVNAISNSQPMTLYAFSTTTSTESAVGSTVAYKAAGAFTAIPGGVYNINGRAAGSSTNLVTRSAVSFSAGHIYTVTARGDMNATVTANKPAFDNTANR